MRGAGRMPETLRRGATGGIVRHLQYLLASHGLVQPRDIDGKFGPGTEDAVREFQRENHLLNDGVVTEEVWNQLTHGVSTHHTLYLGMSGAAVAGLQRALNEVLG